MIRPVVRMQARQVEATAEALIRASAREVRAELEQMGREWVAECQNIVSAELPRRDVQSRRRDTTHAENSFTYRIEEGPNSGFPMRVVLTTLPGVRAAKIGALNFGIQREYEIVARNADFLRWGNAPGDLHKPKQTRVVWKPTGQIRDGYHFMERSRDRVLARRRNR